MAVIRANLSERTNWLRNAVLCRRRARRIRLSVMDALRCADSGRARVARAQHRAAVTGIRHCIAKAEG
jgi:hypothetical protein